MRFLKRTGNLLGISGESRLQQMVGILYEVGKLRSLSRYQGRYILAADFLIGDKRQLYLLVIPKVAEMNQESEHVVFALERCHVVGKGRGVELLGLIGQH